MRKIKRKWVWVPSAPPRDGAPGIGPFIQQLIVLPLAIDISDRAETTPHVAPSYTFIGAGLFFTDHFRSFKTQNNAIAIRRYFYFYWLFFLTENL